MGEIDTVPEILKESQIAVKITKETDARGLLMYSVCISVRDTNLSGMSVAVMMFSAMVVNGDSALRVQILQQNRELNLILMQVQM
jgi:hypothetical protein